MLKSKFKFKSHDFISEKIHSWVSEDKGRSFIRTGDGEGMVLDHPTPEDGILWKHMLAHFGPNLNEKRGNWLADKLSEALTNADIVGLREDNVNFNLDDGIFSLPPNEFINEFRSIFPLRTAERNIRYPSALRLAITTKHIRDLEFTPAAIFTSAWMHFLLSESCSIAQLFFADKKIGIISSTPNVARILSRDFPNKITYFQTPDIFSNEKAANRDGEHYWLSQKLVYDCLADTKPNEVYLVGAGIWGKIY